MYSVYPVYVQAPVQRLDISGQFGGTPNFMLAPPKEQLVEKYFHPDNISSLEKPKHELQKVRDEFKMSESDYGSARVQALSQPRNLGFVYIEIPHIYEPFWSGVVLDG
ncbi:hypothetical protein ACSBR2_042633 [Camellia fascicularis]